MNKTHRTHTALLVIDYAEVQAGDLILAASGPNVYDAGAYDHTFGGQVDGLRVTAEDLFLWRGDADGQTILVIERPAR